MWVVFIMLGHWVWLVPSQKSPPTSLSLRSLPHCKSMEFFVSFIGWKAKIINSINNLGQALGSEVRYHWYQSEVVVDTAAMPGNQEETAVNRNKPVRWETSSAVQASWRRQLEWRHSFWIEAYMRETGCEHDSEPHWLWSKRGTEDKKDWKKLNKSHRDGWKQRRVEWWSDELDMAVRRTMRTLECRAAKLDHKLQNIIQCQLAKCVDKLDVHSTSWERLKTFLKPEKSNAFILDVCGARDNGSMHYDYSIPF